MAGLLGLGVGLGWTRLQVPRYESTASVFVSERSRTADLAPGPGGPLPTPGSEEMRRSYAVLARAPIVLEPVVRNLRLHVTAAQLADQISTGVTGESPVVRITASDPVRARSAQIATAVAHQLPKAARAVTPQPDRTGDGIWSTVVQDALPAAARAVPDRAAALATSGLVGAVIGLLVAATLAARRGGRGSGDWHAPSLHI